MFLARLQCVWGEMRDGGRSWKVARLLDRCPFHTRSSGCILPRRRRPLYCRVFLCGGAVPPAERERYDAYRTRAMRLDRDLSEAMFRQGVNVRSSATALRRAARVAFAALSPEGLAEQDGGQGRWQRT